MSYRPEGWENPYDNHGAVLKEMGNEIAFEAGADAMLKALKGVNKIGYHREGSGKIDADFEVLCRGYDVVNGVIVFIPEEAEMTLQEKRDQLAEHKNNGVDPAFIERLEEEIKQLEVLEKPSRADSQVFLDECAG